MSEPQQGPVEGSGQTPWQGHATPAEQPAAYGQEQGQPTQPIDAGAQYGQQYGQQPPSYATSQAGATYGQQQAGYMPPQYGQSNDQYGQTYAQQNQQYAQQNPQYTQQNPQYAQAGYGYPPRTYSPYAKSKIAAGLLGIFLGCFGVHNFYLGNTGKAVAQLLLTLIGWILLGLGPIIASIWGLVEGILILASRPRLAVASRRQWIRTQRLTFPTLRT